MLGINNDCGKFIEFDIININDVFTFCIILFIYYTYTT